MTNQHQSHCPWHGFGIDWHDPYDEMDDTPCTCNQGAKTMSNAANTDGKYEVKETTIHGYKVTLELFEENGDERSDCTIEKLGTEYASSMGMLMGFGTLEDYQTGDEIIVPERIAKVIIDWAESNGY